MLRFLIVTVLVSTLLNPAIAHHDNEDPWAMHFHQHGIFRAFFGGFFCTLFLIIGALVFYHYCLRGTSFGKTFSLFPKKSMIPITIPFARAPSYMDPNRPETIVLSTSTSPPSVFYSNVHSNPTQGNPWNAPHGVTIKNEYTGYNAL